MTPMEIALLVIGVIIFVLSFLLPDKGSKKTEKQIEQEQEEIRKMMQQEFDSMRLKMNEAANETVDNAVDKAERSLEKTSNEKIMAVGEYGQTVIEEINKNHQEVMFLFDMIKDKHTDLTNTVRKADAAFKEMETLSQTAQNASEGLRRELNVISVTKKGLSAEQRAVFDDPIGDTAAAKTPQPAVNEPSVAAKSYADQVAAAAILNSQPAAVKPQKAEPKTAMDLMSGTTYQKAADSSAMTPIIQQPSAPKNPVAPGASNNNQKILELHKQGLATVDIAKELKLGVGEVKLVLDLFQ